ncbi:MAG: hypothetical protein Q7R49_05230 [Candidatus Daviesbacteria bacterium]|nr:hypothetical protein [Candidatus Daviesbacteria bacterium]
MDDQRIKQVVDYIFKEVLGRDNPFSLEQLQEKFAIDIPKPRKVTCALSREDTWTFSSGEEKVASLNAIEKRFTEDEWMRPAKKLSSVKEVLDAWSEINYLTGEKYINSQEVLESDGIYNSAQVFQSLSIFDSKNIIFGYKLFDCNYMLASRDNSSCSLCIRIKESIYCSASFEVSWSSKVSNSMYIHDCFDVYECLFCSHLRSKKYCIANMQFEKEEYFRIKQIIIDWIIK